jgi:hypothetical protein
MPDAPLAPWEGFDDDDEDELIDKLGKRIERYREAEDKESAHAVLAAVVNHEAYRGAKGDKPRDKLERQARKHFGDVGGWGHK